MESCTNRYNRESLLNLLTCVRERVFPGNPSLALRMRVAQECARSIEWIITHLFSQCEGDLVH